MRCARGCNFRSSRPMRPLRLYRPEGQRRRCAAQPALCSGAAVSALARAASAYTPDAYEDALRVQAQVSALLASEITQAADQGEDASFAALRALQAAVKR